MKKGLNNKYLVFESESVNYWHIRCRKQLYGRFFVRPAKYNFPKKKQFYQATNRVSFPLNIQ